VTWLGENIMPTIDLNGVPIYTFAHRAGDGSIPPLVLIHGAGGRYDHWPPEVRRLDATATYAPDLPGHGRSGGVARRSIAARAADVLALADALGLDRFVAAGHSMGGAVALQLALDAPGRIAGLALIASGARLRIAPDLLGGLVGDASAAIDFIIKHSFGPDVDEDIRRLARRQLHAVDPVTLRADYAACDAFDVRDRLGEIAAPALVVCGTADRMTPPGFSEHLAMRLPVAELRVFEGAGHMLPAERPDALARALGGWLARTFGENMV
jgi:pimeloyl-ACP methyl ester carboxylesterase